MTTIRKAIEGLKILEKYIDEKAPGGDFLYAEHDVIYTIIDADRVTPEDKKKLEEAGWHIDSEFECWSTYC